MARRRQVRGGDERRTMAVLRVSTEEQHLGPAALRSTLETWAKARSSGSMFATDCGPNGRLPRDRSHSRASCAEMARGDAR